MNNSLKDFDFELIKYTNGRSKKIISRESDKREYKEAFNWSNRDKYSKSMASFANKNGGYLIFGVSDNPRQLIGLKNDNFEQLDEKTITEYLNSYFSPEIFFEKLIKNTKGSKIGIIKVQKSEDGPIICIKTNSEVKEADIYYRYNAVSQKIKYPELQNLINKIRESERNNWMKYLEKISKSGIENTAILNLNSGEIIGKKQNLLIDENLLPKLKFIKKGSFSSEGKPTLKLIGNVKSTSIVNKSKSIRITNNTSAPEVRLTEDDLKNTYPLDYAKLTEVLDKRYKNFSKNNRYHELRKNIKEKNKEVFFVRHLDPQNPRSTKKEFYSKGIIELFDSFYEKR